MWNNWPARLTRSLSKTLANWKVSDIQKLCKSTYPRFCSKIDPHILKLILTHADALPKHTCEPSPCEMDSFASIHWRFPCTYDWESPMKRLADSSASVNPKSPSMTGRILVSGAWSVIPILSTNSFNVNLSPSILGKNHLALKAIFSIWSPHVLKHIDFNRHRAMTRHLAKTIDMASKWESA